MARTVLLGALAALFFSSTFILNRAMSLEGGHWVWAASLRYAFMLPILVLWTLATGWVKMIVGVSILTTLYGHYIEGRAIPSATAQA